MAAKIEIFKRGETEPLGAFGYAEIETPLEIDIRNTGTTRMIDIELSSEDIQNSAPMDAEIITHVTTLDPGEVGEGALIWNGEEGPREGNIKIKAVSVG